MKLFHTLSILFHQGKQYIPDPTKAEVPGIFRGRPVISTAAVDNEAVVDCCPLKAISFDGKMFVDLGKCGFCGICARQFPEKIRFTKDYKMATTIRENLIVIEGEDKPIEFGPKPECAKVFKGSLKLRQVSAGGDNSCEWELGATSNVNFDMGRYGIEFVASPRHADGIVITGPITKNMARATQICYDAVPEPKIVALCGTDAISGGLYAESEDIDRSFIDSHKVDLFLAGNPAHPLTIINGLLGLMNRKGK
ncbi:MAG: NADH:ubiquinone oxidoreductase [Bacteroidales bacterium]|jgi:Ni,Fe-hydrogenase III small subunit|nr:NADH:ubiquinone oxidoreductase [Bacteroidales bacterium]